MAQERMCQFPPFPAPPEDVAIVPFREFIPTGYHCIADPSGDVIEVDAWMGIKTVKVLNEEEASKKRRAKRRQRNAGNAVDASGKLIPWWEEWEQGEALRGMSEISFHGQVRLEDRVCIAADDFRVGRTWPEIAYGVRNIWDLFRLYIGLISSIPVYKKVKNKRTGQVDGPNNLEEASDEEEEVPRAKQMKVDIVQDYLEQMALPGKQLEPTPSEDKSSVEAQRLGAFLDDMEKSVKVFLSSHMRDTGMIWAERNLFIAPTVLHFFLRFMLRNGVFAGATEHLGNLKRALAVAATAQKELPLTSKLGQILPGHFDLGCRECWGTKGSMNILIPATLPGDADSVPARSQSDGSSAFESELKNHAVEVVPSDIVLDSITARQVMEDNLDGDHNIVPVTTIPIEGDPWTAAVQAEEYTTESWTDVPIPWLMQLLGPTVFPLMMRTGIVEYSTRRIRDVIAPRAALNKKKTNDMSVVEEALGKRFSRVVMSPWVQSVFEETMDFPRPVIVPGSRGAVAPEAEMDGEDICEKDGWNPYRDDVTILVDDEAAGLLVTGMGLCGTWVQIVPQQEDERHQRECYWYIENLVAVFPSYYTEGEVVEEAGEDEDL